MMEMTMCMLETLIFGQVCQIDLVDQSTELSSKLMTIRWTGTL